MALDDTVAALAGAPLFDLLDGGALRLLAFAAETRHLRAGETLLRRGDRAEGGCVVLRGVLTVEAPGGPVMAGPGAVIGRTALFVPGLHPANVTAREAATVLVVPRPLMRRVLEEFPHGAARIREALAEDLRGLSADLAQVEKRFRAGA